MSSVTNVEDANFYYQIDNVSCRRCFEHRGSHETLFYLSNCICTIQTHEIEYGFFTFKISRIYADNLRLDVGDR
jgi:hypothetical protein